MALATRFPKAPERILGVFKHLDTNLQSHFTPLREKHFGDCYEKLCEGYPEKSIDESLKVKWNKGSPEWRVAVRAYSLVYLIDAVAGGNKQKLRAIVNMGRDEIDKISKKTITELDVLTKEFLSKLGPYGKYDEKITTKLRTYLEKPFVQDPHLGVLISQEKLTEKSESNKGICMGFVVRWLCYQIKYSDTAIVKGKHTGTKFLEKGAEHALNIEDSHIKHGKVVTTGEELLQKLQVQQQNVQKAKAKQGKLQEQRQFENLLLYQTTELTLRTVGLTLQEYGLALNVERVQAQSFKSVNDYDEGWDTFKYKRSDCKPIAEFINKLKPPDYFILSIKWAAEGSIEHGAHVWAGALTASGFRLFDPNMGTFFTNSDKEGLLEAMYEKWAKEDRPINACVYLPVTSKTI